jgi:hypothetical protein
MATPKKPAAVKINPAAVKAEKIAAADEARTVAYQASLSAPPKSPAQQAALSSVAKQTGMAVAAGTALPAAAYGGVPTQTSATAVWNGKSWIEPAKVEDPTYVALLKAMEVYNITGLAAIIDKIRSDYPSITSEDMLTLLRNDSRYNTEYNKRFSGNAALKAAGKEPLDEKTYLSHERQYADIFAKYDVSQFANTAQYTKLIGFGITPEKATARISMGYERVINNKSTLQAFQQFYKQITTGEIVAALLDPGTQIPALERKVTTAEIGGAALRQGLNAFEAATDIQSKRYSNVMGGTIGAGVIEGYNVTGTQATADYEKIAKDLPQLEFLSSISKGVPQYGQQEAEKAEILGLASEQRKKDALLALERARYQGSAGTSATSFTSAKQMF